MAIPSAILGKQSGAFRTRVLRFILASCLALGGAAAQAGVLSVTTSQSNGTVIFNVFDSNPLEMCDGGICFADLAIDFNPAELEFLSDASTLPYLAMANAAPGGSQGAQVLISYLAEETDLAGTNLLFSLGFRALVTKEVELAVGPRLDLGIPPYNPTLVEVSIPVSAVPEPSSPLLGTFGLGVLAFMRRKHKQAK